METVNSRSNTNSHLTNIKLRALSSDDRMEIQKLHEDWFPIRYSNVFYDNAVEGRWLDTKDKLFSVVAYYEDKNISNGNSIIGLLTAQMVSTHKAEDQNLVNDPYRYSTVMYILTLGSHEAHRRRGIASMLIKECIYEAQQQPKCGAVYLHVKADNEIGRHLYEKNGFIKLRYLREYYIIDGNKFDAILYVKYVNGASPPDGWFHKITKPFIVLYTIASQSWSLIFGPKYKSKSFQKDDALQIV